jgi:hypothetical protein
MRRRKLDMERAFFNENSQEPAGVEGTNSSGSGDCPSESQTRTKNEHFTERNGVSPGR